ncbi:type VI secretion system protein TssA [Massilia cavernae]|uniref:Type VI secretion system protein TssA n=1 Tax=Massilia cavernae TaxID=2320864 RepID=A0A418XEK7_9BURK|nr:type VI secretion system protein TssA [Massilia cavernae]RJG10773.1 type VI secretion system protein TssA [Massilia cavernae]
MLNIEQMLAPVSEIAPCGEDIAFSSEVDAIAKARQADDPTLEQGAWVTSLREADWKLVSTRCAQLIEKRSKDLRLAVWLAEASAKTDSFRGLAGGLLLVSALCEKYWDGVHPLSDEGGFEQRIGNLCWIAARLPQLVMEMPVVESGGARYSMRDFEAARSRAGEEGVPDVEAVRRNTPRAFYEALIEDTGSCMKAVLELERVVDERLGADGPGFSAAKSALESVVHFTAPFAQEAGAVASAPAAQDGGAVTVHAQESQVGHGPLQTRAAALAQLRQVADYFRRTEPHSPVAYLADKAAAWGEQPLHVWLRAVVKDEAAYAHIEELLGLQAT